MSFELKMMLLTVLFFTATLPARFRAVGLLTDENRVVGQFGVLNLHNNTGSKSGDTVYLQTQSGSGRTWQKQRQANVNGSAVKPRMGEPEFDPESPRSGHTLSLKTFTVNTSRNTHDEALGHQPEVFDLQDGYQSDSPGPEDQGIYGKGSGPPSYISHEWFAMRPLVHCSEDAMILTANGRGYTHLLVDRVDATPVSVLHLPPNCGYSVKINGRHLVLIASYGGCYILQENGSYILSLLWWGRPIKISCPVSSVSTQSDPSGFCSDFGMAIKTEDVKGAIEGYKVRVNGKWHPLVSNACACLMHVDSPSEDRFVFIPFNAPCARDGGSAFDVLLNGKEFSISCPPPLYLPPFSPHYTPVEYYQPIGPTCSPNLPSVKQEATKPYAMLYQLYPKPYIPYFSHGPSLAGGLPIMQQPYMDPMVHLSEPAQPVGFPGTPTHHQYQSVPFYYLPQIPVLPETATSLKPIVPHVPPFIDQNPFIPFMYYDHIQYPVHLYPNHAYYPFYHQEAVLPSPVPATTTAPSLMDPTTEPTLAPELDPEQTPTPLTIPIPLEPQVLPFPPRVPLLPTASSKVMPSLTCMRKRLVAALPSAKMDSIKIKDVQRNVWVPVASAPAHCQYSLQFEEQGVTFSSPLPTCHSRTLASSMIALSLKFWDTIQSQHRILQLRCPITEPQEPPPTTADSFSPWTWESASPTPKSSSSQPPESLSPPFQFYDSPTSSSKIYKPTTPIRQPTAEYLTPEVLCHSQHMSVILPPGTITSLTVQSPRGMKHTSKEVPLDEAQSHCGYLKKEDQSGFIYLVLPYTSCHMAYQDGQYRIMLKYRSADGRRVEALLSCKIPKDHECNLPVELQLPCGPRFVSAAECNDLGCCYSSKNSTCYYPMDQCTADRHFVFSVPSTLTDPPLSPAQLATAGNNSCTPQRVLAGTALFKIPLDSCGVHKYEVGKTVVYMLEILNTMQSLSLNYGTITRDSPFRLLVECRYLLGTLATVSYLVKSPSLGPSIQAQGVFGVQLRIANDEQYSSYYPQYHRPLQKLLGKPLYLEVRLLNPPDPSVVLLVHYCVAYPRSAKSAWVLIYNGCPNPLDVTPTHEPPYPPPEAMSNHVRRFTVSTFRFLESSKDLSEFGASSEEEEEEEIYFMCATEVCLPSEGPCIEGCLDNSLPVKS
ncbi:uncharacterized protein [Hoplias malabaricus]|uniref:uncharacterized protein isoform X2 n=1 Tax=Hoplias malabaricus TaxID=27720 RepID=UPI0034630EE7